MRRLAFFAVAACVPAVISGVLFLFKDEIRAHIIRVTVFEWMGIIVLINIVFTAAMVLMIHYAEKLKR